MKQLVYYSPKYGGWIGILTIFKDGFLEFEIEIQGGPVESMPETWDGGWELIGEL